MKNYKKDLAKFIPRKEQSECINYINNVYSNNKEKKIFLLDLPTGVGKSYLALMISDWYFKNINQNAKVDIITNSKILQNQYVKSFKSISNLKGKENYSCEYYQTSCGEGKKFQKLRNKKETCEYCPFDLARTKYFNSKISLTNFHYFITQALYTPQVISGIRKPNVLIVDEAHELDDVLTSYISIKITENKIKKLKLDNSFIEEIKNVESVEDYVSFLKDLQNDILNKTETLSNEIGLDETNFKRYNKINQVTKEESVLKLFFDLQSESSKIKLFLDEYEKNPSNWILDKTYNETSKKYDLVLEPIWAYDYMKKYLFHHYDMIFMMSGTILNKSLFTKINGLDLKKTSYYRINSPFSAKRRKIYYLPVGKMSWKHKQNTFKEYKKAIPKILNKYPTEKGIIHTNSFELSKWIEDGIKNERLWFTTANNKNELLESHNKSAEFPVIVSPSLGTGVSFDDNLARFQIIAKVPYPSLASKRNMARKKQLPEWYSWKTCITIMQICGRIIRSKKDYGVTIIIDKSFSDILRYSGHLFPKWFQIAIKEFVYKN